MKYEARGLSHLSQSENGTVPLDVETTTDTNTADSETTALDAETLPDDTLVTGSAMGAIFDNDCEPRINAGTLWAGDDGLPVFSVSLSDPYRETVTVDYTIVGLLPGAAEPVEVARGTATFAPGQQFWDRPMNGLPFHRAVLRDGPTVIPSFLLRNVSGRFSAGWPCIKETHPYPHGLSRTT